MEHEYKWQIPQETLSALAEYLHELPGRLKHETLHLAAVYYDTPDDFVHRQGCALRLRRENGRSVCCLKRTLMRDGAQAIREEYETEAETLAEGLQKLPDAGAPQALCIFLSHQTFRELGRTDFVRNCYLLEPPGEHPFTAEFAVDVGALGAADSMLPFEELELELKSGDADSFKAFADGLEQRFSLIPQPLSKLARAFRAANAATKQNAGSSVTLRAPAKINLSLDILGRLPNGYHTLQSVFQTVSIYDTLTITRTASGQPMTLTCNDPDVPCDERNLVWKAAVKLLGEKPCGIAMHLEKHIPSQAGMGGGSSDCAAALLGIRKLLALPVSDEQLHAYAASLGADCAFFLCGGTVLAEGIGEKLTPLAPLPRYPVVIAKGRESISTPEAYRRIDAVTEQLPQDTQNVLRSLDRDAASLFSVCGNHFDAITDLPETAHIREIMRAHGLNPVLSGSGSAVFGGCGDPDTAEACADALRKAGIQFVTVCETVPEGILIEASEA